MMEQYFDLLGACAQGGAQAFGDAVLWAQVYLITCSVMLVALIIACWALLGRADGEPSLIGGGLQMAMRQRLRERFSAAWAADEAAEAALRQVRREVERATGQEEP
jgi:hypothetical protein